MSDIIGTVRAYVDFGHGEEIINAAGTYASLARMGVRDALTESSLRYRGLHPDDGVRRAVGQALSGLG